jgi:hypothetical protein
MVGVNLPEVNRHFKEIKQKELKTKWENNETMSKTHKRADFDHVLLKPSPENV